MCSCSCSCGSVAKEVKLDSDFYKMIQLAKNLKAENLPTRALTCMILEAHKWYEICANADEDGDVDIADFKNSTLSVQTRMLLGLRYSEFLWEGDTTDEDLEVRSSMQSVLLEILGIEFTNLMQDLKQVGLY